MKLGNIFFTTATGEKAKTQLSTTSKQRTGGQELMEWLIKISTERRPLVGWPEDGFGWYLAFFCWGGGFGFQVTVFFLGGVGGGAGIGK